MTTSYHVCITFPLYQYISIPSLPSIFLGYDFAPDYTVLFSHDIVSSDFFTDIPQIMPIVFLSFFYGYSHDYP